MELNAMRANMVAERGCAAPLRYGETRERRRQVILVSFDFFGERADKSTEFADTTPWIIIFSPLNPMLSTLTVTTIGLTCKAFLNSGLCSIQVNGLQTLKDALKSRKRNSGQGIITGSSCFQSQPLTIELTTYHKCPIISQRA